MGVQKNQSQPVGLMSIGTVERMTGINANTLRMWERRYGLGPSSRSQGGQREYSMTDVDHLRLLKKLINHGMRIGDIAKLPTKTLSSLLVDMGDNTPHETSVTHTLKTHVIGTELTHHFMMHHKRYPYLAIECSDTNAIEQWLHQPALENTDLLIIQLESLNQKHMQPLLNISQQKIHIIVLYWYCQKTLVEELEKQGITVLSGSIKTVNLDETIKKVLRLQTHLSDLDRDNKAFDVALPTSRPKHFSEEALIEAEALSTTLNCECPPHLTDLIRRLNAFEAYSKTCGAENWRQAAIHACIYSYTNQARHLLEKALQAVLDE